MPERPSMGEVLLEMPFLFILLIIVIFVYVLAITIGWRAGKRTANKIINPASVLPL